MIDRYETLRHRALKGNHMSAELALFIGRGMIAWMHAWKAYTPVPRSDLREKQQQKVELPASLRVDLVMTLLNMVINIKRGQT